jgi:phage/plasmid primase-like uncharacterized protein
LNFIGINSLLPEKFDDTSLLDFADFDIRNVRNAGKRLIAGKISGASSVR